MKSLVAGKDARAWAARAGECARHQPEQTLLYQLLEAHYPAFVAHLAARERMLPAHVVGEFEDYIRIAAVVRSPVTNFDNSAPQIGGRLIGIVGSSNLCRLKSAEA